MSNRKYGKTRYELGQDHTVKIVTFDPRAGGKYRCNQTGHLMSRTQILSYVNEIVAGGSGTTVISQGKGSPPKKQHHRRPSKYRSK